MKLIRSYSNEQVDGMRERLAAGKIALAGLRRAQPSRNRFRMNLAIFGL